MKRYEITGINPEPWTAPAGSVQHRGGKTYVQMSSSEALNSYKEAIKEFFEHQYPHAVCVDDQEVLLDVHFWFWRQLVQYQGKSRKVTKNFADATNMQKALEDALQGVLYANDRMNRAVSSTIMEAGPSTVPFIVVEVRHWPGPNPLMSSTYEAMKNKLSEPKPERPKRDTSSWF